MVFQVRVHGEPCVRAIAMNARGGFRMALASQLEDEWQQYKAARDAEAGGGGSASAPGGAAAGDVAAGSGSPLTMLMAPAPAASAVAEADVGAATAVATAAPVVEWEPQGLPGVMEAVMLSYNLSAASVERSEQYAWFSSVVALDDSCGEGEWEWSEGRAGDKSQGSNPD